MTKTTRYAYAADRTQIYFETFGDRGLPAIFLGPHFYATPIGIADTRIWIDSLVADYFVIVADYPRGVGMTPNSHSSAFSVERAVDEIEIIADAAGVGAFAWLGYSFGGALGVQLACRSGRLWAMAAGGFPPLNAPFDILTSALSDLAAQAASRSDSEAACRYRSSEAFYRSLLSWNAVEHVAKLSIPCLAFMGGNDLAQGMSDRWPVPLAPRMRSTEAVLRDFGWEIAWIDDQDHAGAIEPARALPIITDFFRRSVSESALGKG